MSTYSLISKEYFFFLVFKRKNGCPGVCAHVQWSISWQRRKCQSSGTAVGSVFKLLSCNVNLQFCFLFKNTLPFTLGWLRLLMLRLVCISDANCRRAVAARTPIPNKSNNGRIVLGYLRPGKEQLLELGIWVVAYAITYLQKSPEIFIAQNQSSLATTVVSINQ